MRKFAAVATALIMMGSASANAESYKLVTGNDYKPFTDESLTKGGMVTDLVRTAYENAGHDISIEFLPWRRGEKMMAQGKFAATFPYVRTEERAEKYLFSEPVFVAEERPIVLPDDAGTINTLADTAGKTLCMPVGYQTSSTGLKKMIEDGDVEEAKPRNIESCFKMLKAGRVDFLSLERPNGLVTAQAVLGSADQVHFEDLVLNKTGLHLIFSRKVDSSPAAVDAFNGALKKLRDSGQHEEIVKKHLGG